MTTTKSLGLAGALAATMAAGTALGRFTAAEAPTATIAPIGMRWLGPTSDAAHPYYYGVAFDVQLGTAHAQREVICPTDGNPPSLDGYPYSAAATLCSATATYAQAVAAAQGSLASSIALSNAPDMAQPSSIDAGQ